MGMQQMMLGRLSLPPLDGSSDTLIGAHFEPEPAPSTWDVSASGAAGATGGTGSYTYTWSILSGSASISGSTTSSTCSIQATVNKGANVTGTIRCAISDGISSINKDRSYSLTYTTDA